MTLEKDIFNSAVAKSLDDGGEEVDRTVCSQQVRFFGCRSFIAYHLSLGHYPYKVRRA